MSIIYSIEKRDQYLYLAGEGKEGSLDENIENLQNILNACKENGCPCVLVDDRNVIYTSSISSLYEFAKQANQIDTQRYIQKAAVVANPKFKNDNNFFENTMRNRNINLRIFYEIEKAEKWLEDKKL